MGLTPYGEALRAVLRAADARGLLDAESVAADDCAGRVSAESVRAGGWLPAFDNSSMDGFAVRSAEAARAPVRLPVVGTLAAGDPVREFPAGAVEIMTGAPLPPGFDAVVRLEDVRAAEDGGSIVLSTPPEAGDYVRRAGSDVPAGTELVRSGALLDERHVLAFAALGIERIEARRRPRLALISTGRELAEPGRPPEPGQIRNSTAAYLAAAAPAFGAALRSYGSVPDDEAAFLRKAEEALSDGCDALLTTGAVSMGRFDFVTQAAPRLGARIAFHKTAVRPGKPVLFGAFDRGPVLFGLPGNPISTVVGFRFFVVPYLRRLLGLPDERPAKLRLERGLEKPEGLRCFFKARAKAGSVEVLDGQASYRIEPLLKANAWAVLPEEGARAEAGDLLEVVPLGPEEGPAEP